VRQGEGNEITISGKFPKWMAARLEEVVYECRQQIKGAIANHSEFIRVACWRLMNDLEPVLKNKGFSNRMAKERAMLKLVKNKEDDMRFYDDIGEIEQCVERLAKRDAQSEIESLLREQIEVVKGMDDDYWRNRWLTEFDNRFKRYFREMKIKLPKRISVAPRDAQKDEGDGD